ncbi:MAG: thiamine diphosphokinase [Tannerella sp.]|jgi:thiamine pyrophosphokinase|nr:thiamine diphosphokinase [Tannerella sp.]
MITIEIIGAVIGLLYLWLEYKANIWLWPVGVVMPLLYIYIFYAGKFYADMGVNVYYLFACLYGWIRWRKDGQESGGDVMRITRFPLRRTGRLLTAGAGLFGGIALLLRFYTDSPAPYGDALTTALSMLAMWMLAHKYAEQWVLWFFVNGISTALYLWKDLYPTGALFAVYTVVSVFGYRKWLLEAQSNRRKPPLSTPSSLTSPNSQFSILNSQFSWDAVVLANGEFPSHPVPLAMLERYRERIICCDGAADALLQAGFYPAAVVGDGDSLSPGGRAKLAERLVCISEQDTNDLTKTVRYCLSRGYKRLLILGATGKREDHTLGNIGLLTDYMDDAEVEMWTNHGTLTPARGNVVFESYAGQPVSVFCLNNAPLTLDGLKWPVTNRVITSWWQASLNEALSDRFRVQTAGKVVVFRQYERN